MIHKICNKCNLEKSGPEFTADLRNKDGLQSICKKCRVEINKSIRLQRRMVGPSTDISEKKCSKCFQIKSIDSFFKDSGNSDGFMSKCKECKNKKTAEWRGKKREEYNAYMREYRTTHPAKYAMERNRGLRSRYGIDQRQYDEMLKRQNGSCAICKSLPGARPFHVDHCHNTEKVRGLLCASCNRSIAILDDKELLQRAFEYLKS